MGRKKGPVEPTDLTTMERPELNADVALPTVKYHAYLRKMTRYNPTRGGTSAPTISLRPVARQRCPRLPCAGRRAGGPD